jgi:hypothetical protein
VKEPELELERREIESIWADEKYLIVRDDSIPNGALVATSKMVYSPNASKVEILPDGVDIADPIVNPGDPAASPVGSKSSGTSGNKASASTSGVAQGKSV